MILFLRIDLAKGFACWYRLQSRSVLPDFRVIVVVLKPVMS